jgi:hypothetical protein
MYQQDKDNACHAERHQDKNSLVGTDELVSLVLIVDKPNQHRRLCNTKKLVHRCKHRMFHLDKRMDSLSHHRNKHRMGKNGNL